MRLRYICAVVAVVLVVSPQLWAGERVIVELNDGSQVKGEVLKEDEKTIYLEVAGQVIAFEREKVNAIKTTAGGEDARLKDLKEFKLYKTARRSVKSVAALTEEMGPAIVTVRTPIALGTGWFCDPNGYVVTNCHVVAGERSISVTAFKKEEGRYEKKVYKKVRLVALDQQLDLALLKIEDELDMEVPQLYIGDSTDMEQGDKAFTIGNPMGLERSISQGIISKVNRNFEGRLYIQTTAQIAPGSSGGPLFNEKGEVIGVTNMGYIFLDGLGFAIPSKYVKEFLDNVEAFAFDADNPNSGIKYMATPVTSTDGALQFTDSDFIKTGPGVSCLTLADINGDGVKEIVFVNNNKGEIGVVRLRGKDEKEKLTADYEDINRLPPSERFKLDTHAVNNKMSSIVIEDMNGDTRDDILVYGDIDGLSVLDQQEDGTFSSPRKIDDLKISGRTDALKVVDLDGDGKKDIFALGSEEISIYDENGERRSFPLNAAYRNNLTDYQLQDVNGDGRLDVVLFCASDFYAIHLLLQNSDGDFVEEEFVPCHLSGPVVPCKAGPRQQLFLTLDKGKNRVRRLLLRQHAPEAKKGRAAFAARALSLDAKPGTTCDFVVDDLNGDGKLDIISASKDENDFLIFEAGAEGFKLHRSPCPKKVEGIQLYKRADGKTALFCFSEEDKIFGVSAVTSDGVTFPRPINTEGRVQFLWLGEVDGAEKLIWIEKVDRSYFMRSLSADAISEKALNGGSGSIDVQPDTFLFGKEEGKLDARLPSRPKQIAFADFNGDGVADLVAYWAYSGKESLYLGLGQGRFKSIIMDEEFLEEKEDNPLLVADIDGDGGKEVLLVQPGFVRVLKVDAKNKLYVEQQFNWKFDEVSRLIPYGDQKPPRFLALTKNAAKVVRFDKENSRFELEDTIDLAGMEHDDLKVADLEGDGLPDILMQGRNAVQVLRRNGARRDAQSTVVYDAKLDYFSYWDLYANDLDGDGRDEVILFDSKKAMFEIHRFGADGGLEPIFRHRLFEKSISQRRESGSLELPREMVVGDVDGNGRADLVFILQDHIGIYAQRPGPAQKSKAGEQGDKT